QAADQAPAPPLPLPSVWSFSREQAKLKASVVEEDTEEWQKDSSFAGLERVGGVDLSYIKGDDTSACASLVVLSYPALEVMASEQLLSLGLCPGVQTPFDNALTG
uniref:Uncharacterized protein n=1 Tax=Buteo japonicus TaxID=224669 RepID=A0A8B9Z4Z8_9AVES